MKINKITIAFLIAMFSITNAFAQSSTTEKILFSYEQLPVFKISSDKTYKRVLINTFEEDIIAEKAAIDEENERSVQDAKDEREEYKEKSTGDKLAGKILLGEKKPSGRAQIQRHPFYPKVWEEQSTLGLYVNIPGMTVSENAKAVVKVYIERFSYDYSTAKSDKGFYYKVNVKLPVTLEVYNEDGIQVTTKTFEIKSDVSFSSSSDFTSEFFTSEAARDKHWQTNQHSKLRQLEGTRLAENMKKLNAYLIENVAYNTIARKTTIGLVKDKKNDTYQEINSLYPKIIETYNKVNTNQKDELEKELMEAIAIWKKELETMDPNNKKARINASIGMELYLNIAEAYIWLNKFDEARSILIKYLVLDPKGKDKKYKDLDELLKDQKIRYEANKS